MNFADEWEERERRMREKESAQNIKRIREVEEARLKIQRKSLEEEREWRQNKENLRQEEEIAPTLALIERSREDVAVRNQEAEDALYILQNSDLTNSDLQTESLKSWLTFLQEICRPGFEEWFGQWTLLPRIYFCSTMMVFETKDRLTKAGISDLVGRMRLAREDRSLPSRKKKAKPNTIYDYNQDDIAIKALELLLEGTIDASIADALSDEWLQNGYKSTCYPWLVNTPNNEEREAFPKILQLVKNIEEDEIFSENFKLFSMSKNKFSIKDKFGTRFLNYIEGFSDTICKDPQTQKRKKGNKLINDDFKKRGDVSEGKWIFRGRDSILHIDEEGFRIEPKRIIGILYSSANFSSPPISFSEITRVDVKDPGFFSSGYIHFIVEGIPNKKPSIFNQKSSSTLIFFNGSSQEPHRIAKFVREKIKEQAKG